MANLYPMLKHLHMTFALLSVIGFTFRWVLALCNSPMRQQRWLKVAPHIIDTVLLVSALMLCWILRQYPFVSLWLSAKVGFLVLYIWLGLAALKWAKTRAKQLLYGLAALLCFAQILAIAFSRSPMGLLAGV